MQSIENSPSDTLLFKSAHLWWQIKWKNTCANFAQYCTSNSHVLLSFLYHILRNLNIRVLIRQSFRKINNSIFPRFMHKNHSVNFYRQSSVMAKVKETKPLNLYKGILLFYLLLQTVYFCFNTPKMLKLTLNLSDRICNGRIWHTLQPKIEHDICHIRLD
jgi:hypothetical protein